MSIKRVDPKATFKIISEFDSALISETQEELRELAKEKKDTRYMQYLESFDESKLIFKPDEKPTYFVIRCLLNSEFAVIQERHMEVNVETKTFRAKNSSLMMFDLFNTACLGMIDENGNTVKVTADEVGMAVATGIGATISMLTTLGKHLKK